MTEKKGKRFGDGWLFTSEDESDNSQNKSENANISHQNISTHSNQNIPTNFTQTFQPTTARDPKIEEKLKATMKAANLPGPDYFEFKQQLDVLKNVISDERTRFAAAFSSLTVQGVDKNKILESASHYVKILNAENGKFESAIASRSEEKISLKEKEVQALLQENQGFENQIENLKKNISENSGRITVLSGEISQAKNEIEGAKQRFKFTLLGFIDEIEKDAQKVGTYVQ
jgi:chromosome segregation ATPase